MTTFFNAIPLAASKWQHKNGNTYTRLCWDCAKNLDLKKEFSEALNPLSDAITKSCSTCGRIAFTVVNKCTVIKD